MFSHEEFHDPAGDASGGVVARARGGEVAEFPLDDPVVVGPGSPPEDGSCGQYAVQFHVTTSMLIGLKRIADLRGVSVPEVCRQVMGVFVAQQEGELGALLAAETEVAEYRPSLGQGLNRTGFRAHSVTGVPPSLRLRVQRSRPLHIRPGVCARGGA